MNRKAFWLTALSIVIPAAIVFILSRLVFNEWLQEQGWWADLLGQVLPAVIAAIIGFFTLQEKIKKLFTGNELVSPIKKISLEDIAKKVRPGIETEWIDRKTFKFEPLLYQENLRIFIQGPRSIGKTREAFELIKRLDIAGRISKENIYEFIPLLIKSGISTDIFSCDVDPNQPALLLVDDLPKHYPEKALPQLGNAFARFQENRDLFIIATGRSEQMRNTKHRDWLLENQFEILSFDKIRGRDVQHLIIDICQKNGIELEDEARQVFRKRLRACTPGIVHLLIRGKKAAQIERIDAETAEELVQEIRKQELYEFNNLLKKQQGLAVLVQSLAMFYRWDVQPYTSLVLSYAYYLWKKQHPDANPGKMKPAFKNAIQILEGYGRIDEEDFQLADVLVEQSDLVEDRKSLGDFLLHHRRRLQHPLLRVLYRESHQHAEALFILGIQYLEEENPDAALELLSAALKLRQYAFIYNSRGIAYDEKGCLDLAIKDYTQAIRLDSGDATAFNNRGAAHVDKGCLDLAIQDYNKAISLASNDATAYTNRGRAYSLRGDHDLAIQDYNKAIEIDQDYAAAYLNRASSLMRQQRLEEAEKDCNTAERLAPEHPDTHARRARLLYLQGEYDAAIERYKRAKALEEDPGAYHFDIALPALCLGRAEEALGLMRERLGQHIPPYEVKEALFWFQALKASQPDLPGLDEALALLRGKD